MIWKFQEIYIICVTWILILQIAEKLAVVISIQRLMLLDSYALPPSPFEIYCVDDCS